jgi:SulP family sulfate permease
VVAPREDGRFEERPAPAALASGHVAILEVYGSLLYVGSRTLQARLPDPAAAQSPVVVLRLRGRTTLGATFIKVVTDYADRLADADGRLYLSGLQPDLTERLRRTRAGATGLARSGWCSSVACTYVLLFSATTRLPSHGSH